MIKKIYSCEVFDYLKKNVEVFYIDYLRCQIFAINTLSVIEVQDLVDFADKENDCKTYFYTMEDENEKDL